MLWLLELLLQEPFIVSFHWDLMIFICTTSQGQKVFHTFPGMCKDNAVEPMVFEDSPCKEKGHYFVEEYLKQQNVPFTIFRYLTIVFADIAYPHRLSLLCV